MLRTALLSCLAFMAADVAAFRGMTPTTTRSVMKANSCLLNRCLSCPDLCPPSLRPRERGSTLASLSATIACTDISDPVAAAALRSAKAQLAARAQKLIGKPVPEAWTDGEEFVVGDSEAEFGVMEMAVVRGKFARVHIGPGKDGMYRVETHGDQSNRGSATFRSLGKPILGKLQGDRDARITAALEYYNI